MGFQIILMFFFCSKDREVPEVGASRIAALQKEEALEEPQAKRARTQGPEVYGV